MAAAAWVAQDHTDGSSREMTHFPTTDGTEVARCARTAWAEPPLVVVVVVLVVVVVVYVVARVHLLHRGLVTATKMGRRRRRHMGE